MSKTNSIGALRDWRLRLVMLVWRFGFPIFFTLALPGAIVRLVRRGSYREKFAERFGLFNPATRARLEAGGPWAWMHAVSVGEMLMALRLAEEWKVVEADLQLVLSVTTTTGFAQARARQQPWMEVIYHPIDFTGAVRRTLAMVRPNRIVFVEAAIWPNLLLAARMQGVPCAIVNARMSPRSERRYRKMAWLMRPVFRLINLIAIQDERQRAIWELLGVAPSAVQLTGSMKCDIAPPDAAEVEVRRAYCQSIGFSPETRFLLGGSTWPGEEAVLARILKGLREKHPRTGLILAPRHVERTASIVGELLEMDLRVALRSGSAQSANPDVLVVNTTGELRHWYGVGDVLFIGKSLFEVGGQNPVEAVVTGRPVLSGPHMENFRDIVPLLENAGLLKRASDETELAACFELALGESQTKRRMDESDPLASHRGATKRTAMALRELGRVPATCRMN